MVGQKNNIALIRQLVKEDRLPKFILLSGNNHTGKNYLCKEIANILNYPYLSIEKGIDNIRELINEANTHKTERLFILPYIEELSARGQEALLKIIEEPPIGCYIIATTNNIQLLKTTIKNRAYIINIEIYSKEDLESYCKLKNYSINKYQYLFGEAIYSPSLINFYLADGNENLINYMKEVEKFVAKICKLNAANAFKASNLFQLKEEEVGKIDILRFLQLLATYLVSKKEYKYSKVCNKLSLLCLTYINQLKINGIQKEVLIKNFILDYRKECLANEFIGFTEPN